MRTATLLKAALPVTASRTAGSVMSLTLAPGSEAACFQPTLAAPVPVSVRDGDDAGPDVLADLERDLDLADPRDDPDDRPFLERA